MIDDDRVDVITISVKVPEHRELVLVKLTDTGEESLSETADHIGVLGKTDSGAVFTADTAVRRMLASVSKSEGWWLGLTSNHPYGFQAGDLKMTSNIAFAAPDESAVSGGFRGAAINVGEVYAHLLLDLHEGTYNTPGFDHALRDACLIDAVSCAAERGERQKVVERIEGFGDRATSCM